MSAEAFQSTLRWLSSHAQFPATRLDSRAEVLLCIAALAHAEEEQQRQRHLFQRRNPAETSAQRTHAMRRSLVHFKCDNSAKV